MADFRLPSDIIDAIELYERGDIFDESIFSHLFLVYENIHESDEGHGPPVIPPLRHPPNITNSSGDIIELLANILACG